MKVAISIRENMSIPRLEVMQYLRELNKHFNLFGDLSEISVHANDLISGGVYTHGKELFYALANGNTTFGNYPEYNFEETFKDVPHWLKIDFEYGEETKQRILKRDIENYNIELLNRAANGDVNAALEFCKKLHSGVIHWGVACG